MQRQRLYLPLSGHRRALPSSLSAALAWQRGGLRLFHRSLAAASEEWWSSTAVGNYHQRRALQPRGHHDNTVKRYQSIPDLLEYWGKHKKEMSPAAHALAFRQLLALDTPHHMFRRIQPTIRRFMKSLFPVLLNEAALFSPRDYGTIARVAGQLSLDNKNIAVVWFLVEGFSRHCQDLDAETLSMILRVFRRQAVHNKYRRLREAADESIRAPPSDPDDIATDNITLHGQSSWSV